MTTIRDVAAKAGVSAATVSRVLSFDTTLSVTNETRDRVLAIAKELNYTPRARNKSRTDKGAIKLGVILCTSEEQDDPYWHSIRQGIETECQKREVSSIVIRWDERNTSLQNISDIDELHGMIVISEREGTSEFVKHLHVPLVFIDPHSSTEGSDSVVIDFEKGTSDALQHLFDLGHTQIGFIGGTRLNGQDPRYKTFERVMRERHLFNPEYVYMGTWGPSDGYALMKQAISRGHLPTAWFIASDPMAIGAMHALHESRLKIPDDVAIVSFDGIELSAHTTPPLTTVKVFSEWMGKIAVQLLFERIQGREVSLNVSVSTALIVRASSGPHDLVDAKTATFSAMQPVVD